MDYEKKYNEALERARQIKDGKDEWRYSDLTEITPALTEIFPELRESEDERVMGDLIGGLMWQRDNLNSVGPHDNSLILPGFCLTVGEHLAYLEKQKDASKAIEAVDRIDKYIDEHLANAHDMKDSNPDKKYYRGWDDALGEMAGILQDVYSEKENKFAPRVLPCSAAWFEDGEEKQKEQKPAEPFDEELERHQKELYDFKVFAAKQAKEHHISFVHDFEWNFFCAELLSYFHEQKQASTEDMPYITDEHFYDREPVDSFKYKLAEYMTKCCTKKEGPYGYTYGISAESILKLAEEELLKRGVVQKPVEWSEEDEKIAKEIEEELWYPGDFPDYPSKEESELYDDCQRRLSWFKNKIKSLRPQKLDASKLENFDPVDVLNRIKTEWPMVWEKVVGKQEWSEEDEKILERFLGWLQGTMGEKTYSSWLKSVRERFNSKKCDKEMDLDDRLEEISRNGLENAHTIDFSKEYENSKKILEKGSGSTEWSEEDENCLSTVICCFEKFAEGRATVCIQPGDAKAYLKVIKNWKPDNLKSLRPHWKPSEVCYGVKGDPDPAGVWKPSEEQMNALNFAITYFIHETSYKNPTELRDLYEQLKRLM